MVIIEYQYSTDDRTGNHDHDAGKVGSYRIDDADAHQDTKAMKRVLFFHIPIKGVLDEGGTISVTTFMKKVKDMRMVISKVTFSPDSGGK